MVPACPLCRLDQIDQLGHPVMAEGSVLEIAEGLVARFVSKRTENYFELFSRDGNSRDARFVRYRR